MAPAATTEKTPLTHTGDAVSWFSAVRTVLCGGVYIVVSSCLIHSNKSLMVEGGAFPFSVPLVMIHAAVTSILTAILFIVVPSWFPSLTGPMKLAVDYDLVVRSAMPIAFAFSIALVLSNTAYVHSDVAFLQMMKESNVVIVYLLSVLVALESFSWRNAGVLTFVVLSTFVSIRGALDFSKAGFFMQGASQLAECVKITLQALILSNAGKKLDVLSYVLVVMPLCFCFLAAALMVLSFLNVKDSAFSIPSWEQFEAALPYLVPNSLTAFALNVIVAMFMKWSSGVAFVLAGILKDVCIVCFGVTLMGEDISKVQTVSFSLQVLGIYVWAMLKMYPAEFEAGFLPGLAFVLCGCRASREAQASAATATEPSTVKA